LPPCRIDGDALQPAHGIIFTFQTKEMLEMRLDKSFYTGMRNAYF